MVGRPDQVYRPSSTGHSDPRRGPSIPHGQDPRWARLARPIVVGDPSDRENPSVSAHGQQGFSVVEIVIALGLTIVLTAIVLLMVQPVDGLFATQGEAADLQQRVRVGVDTLQRELHQAGAGAIAGTHEGPLVHFLAPVLPYRSGRFGDGPGVFRADTVSLIYVPAGSPESTIATPLASRAGTVDLAMGATCIPGFPSCGFVQDMGVLVYDNSGAYTRFTVEASQSATLVLRHDSVDSSKTFAPGSKIVAIESPTYSVDVDPVSNVPRLVRATRDGSRRVPVVDHVVSLRFEYYGDPRPPLMRTSRSAPEGPWTTYGPRPPDVATRIGAYPSGENCVFYEAGGPAPAPRLPILPGAAGSALVRLSPADLRDGPWCPHDAAPNRFDADLLRIRAVDVTVRVESALAALRGPGSAWFARGGTARRAVERRPDIEAHFRVAPRNLLPAY